MASSPAMSGGDLFLARKGKLARVRGRGKGGSERWHSPGPPTERQEAEAARQLEHRQKVIRVTLANHGVRERLPTDRRAGFGRGGGGRGTHTLRDDTETSTRRLVRRSPGSGPGCRTGDGRPPFFTQSTRPAPRRSVPLAQRVSRHDDVRGVPRCLAGSARRARRPRTDRARERRGLRAARGDRQQLCAPRESDSPSTTPVPGSRASATSSSSARTSSSWTWR